MGNDVYNASDEKQVSDREKEMKAARDLELEDIRVLLSSGSGLRFFRRLIMVDGKILSTTFTGNSTGFYKEGWRAFALKVLADIVEAAPEKVHKIIIDKKEGNK